MAGTGEKVLPGQLLPAAGLPLLALATTEFKVHGESPFPREYGFSRYGSEWKEDSGYFQELDKTATTLEDVSYKSPAGMPPPMAELHNRDAEFG